MAGRLQLKSLRTAQQYLLARLLQMIGLNLVGLLLTEQSFEVFSMEAKPVRSLRTAAAAFLVTLVVLLLEASCSLLQGMRGTNL